MREGYGMTRTPVNLGNGSQVLDRCIVGDGLKDDNRPGNLLCGSAGKNE
jgi:uracil-DNA glycosylase